jgi:hypothetical protein
LAFAGARAPTETGRTTTPSAAASTADDSSFVAAFAACAAAKRDGRRPRLLRKPWSVSCAHVESGDPFFVRPPVASRTAVEGAGRKPATSPLRGFAPPADASGAHGHIRANGGRRSRLGGVRTSVLSVLTLVAVAAVVIIVLARNLGPPEQASPPGARPRLVVPASASDGPEITSTIARRT